MIFRRRRFGDVVDRQLGLFADEDADLLVDVEDALERYNGAERDDAEELYGDYLLAAEACAERLAEIRDAYARTLSGETASGYSAEFDREASRRWPALALALRET